MKILYVGPFSYPSSQANSLRVRGMTEALVAAGHEVHIVCMGEPGELECADGVRVTRIAEYDSGIFAKLSKGFRGLFLGDATVGWLEGAGVKADAVIMYGTHLGYLLRLRRFCRRCRIGLFLDVVEWLQPSHLPGGVLGPFSIVNEFCMRVGAKRTQGIFAISRYLESHFRKLGCNVLRVPPLFCGRAEQAALLREQDGKLHICYVGTPGKKESLRAIFDGLKSAGVRGADFCMHFVGMTTATAEELGLVTKDSAETFKFYGTLPNDEAVRIVQSCDFMLLLREDKRFSRAGFPSKVAESLALGTPIISNITSNLDEYLEHRVNAVVVQNTSAAAIADAVCIAAAFDAAQLGRMRVSARVTGDKFSPHFFAHDISCFIAKFALAESAGRERHH